MCKGLKLSMSVRNQFSLEDAPLALKLAQVLLVPLRDTNQTNLPVLFGFSLFITSTDYRTNNRWIRTVCLLSKFFHLPCPVWYISFLQ
jgi:hypothetical protein